MGNSLHKRAAEGIKELSNLRFRENILLEYISMAPLPLAFERSVEGEIFAGLRFERPILDLGCGEGLFAKLVFAEPIETGIDPNPRELAKARAYGSHAQLIQCSGNDIPMSDASYKTIFSNSVLEHIPEIEPVLAEVHRLLATGGRFYLTVPSDNFAHFTLGYQILTSLGLDQLANRYQSWFNSFWRHYHFYSIEQWKNLAGKSGFEIIKAYRYDSKSLCLLNDCLVPLSIFGFIMKKLINQWTLVPRFRRIAFYPVFWLARPFITQSTQDEKGGLIFMMLSKAE